MEKTTQKNIKGYIQLGIAEDITNYSHEQIKELYHSHRLEKIVYSCGAYGINGGIVKDENGNMYAITARNSNLFYLF